MDRNEGKNNIPSYKRASDRDAMLDMLSKRAIIDYGERVCASKGGPTVYVVIFDLDNFKAVNDTFGHLYGDAVISMVAGSIKNLISSRDIIGRFGGDELLLVDLKNTELQPIQLPTRPQL